MNNCTLIVIAEVEAQGWQAQGIKEDLAMHLERWGNTRVVSVEQKPQPRMEQLTIGGMGRVERPVPRMRR